MVVGKKGRREGGLLVTATTFVCCSCGRIIDARSNAASSERRQAFVHRTARAVPHDDCRTIAAGRRSKLDASLAESNVVSPNISKQDEHPAQPAMTLFLQAGVTHGGTRVRDTQQRDTPSGKRRN